MAFGLMVSVFSVQSSENEKAEVYGSTEDNRPTLTERIPRGELRRPGGN